MSTGAIHSTGSDPRCHEFFNNVDKGLTFFSYNARLLFYVVTVSVLLRVRAIILGDTKVSS